jgi:hypothetical protein
MMRLREIHGKAGSSIGCTPDGGRWPSRPGIAFGGTASLQAMIDDTDKKIEGGGEGSPRVSLSLSIPGFGPVVLLHGHRGDRRPPSLRRTGGRWLKTAGYGPKRRPHGEEDRLRPVISKRGKADLRSPSTRRAFSASLRNGHFIRYYTGKDRGQAEGKGHRDKISGFEACRQDACHRLGPHEEEGVWFDR